MLKFFRRIRQKLLSENKFTQYLFYAIGEIALVVIGILIALQINTWNEQRISTKEERRIFQDLSEELQFNKFLMENGKRIMGEVVATADSMLITINNPTISVHQENLDKAIDKLTWVWQSGLPTSLYDVLSGSGDFKLISSTFLRKKLTDLKGNQEYLLKWEEDQAHFVDRELRPFLNSNTDRTRVRTNLKAENLVTTYHKSIFPIDNREILQNSEFANLLIDLIFFTKKVTETYGRIERDINEIDSLIHAKYPEIVTKPYIPY